MTREEIERQCMAVCPSGTNSECAFARDGAVGFIDTSVRADGSRGIAFFSDKAAVNFDGYAREIPYKDILSVQIAESYENRFADELIITGHNFDIRISDYSLDKLELKRLIDGLCAEGFTPGDDEPDEPELGEEIPESREIAGDIPTETEESVSGDISENQPDINNSAEDNPPFENPVIEDEPYESELGEEIPEGRETEETILTETEESVSDDISENQPDINNSAEDNPPFEDHVIEDEPDEPELGEEIPENREIAEDIPAETEESVSGDISENQPDINNSAEDNPPFEDHVIEDEPDEPELGQEIPENRDIAEDIPTETEESVSDDISENQPDLNNSAEDNPPFENPVIEDEPYESELGEEIPENREITEDIPTETEESVFDDISENQPDLNNSAEDISPFENPVIPEFDDDDAEITPIKVLPKISEKIPEESFSFEVVENSGNDGNDNDDFDEQAELERISAMSHEQTMSYLADAFAEINGINPDESPNEDAAPDNEPDADESSAEFSGDTTASEITDKRAAEEAPEKSRHDGQAEAPVLKKGESGLTTEPAWGDIYIKASRSLRELCEEGKLSMDMIRAELRERLLPSAEAFAKITNDESKIPKVLMPKITELRSAANNFDEYFSYGDDIGTRAMFFMLYQMLSYADRIVENPEAKARLNDFFRRFGSAGIILSMLDMRV